MKFEKLHETVPLARYGKEKSLWFYAYDDVALRMPGRHAEDTTPKGGDFCVVVTDTNMEWVEHQFTHTDIFEDVERRAEQRMEPINAFMESYLNVIGSGTDPDKLAYGLYPANCIKTLTFYRAVQCLAVAEHRRYSNHEAVYGGRFLPFRFAAGIAEGLWTASEAAKDQRYGRSAVERLEKAKGTPVLTQKLMG